MQIRSFTAPSGCLRTSGYQCPAQLHSKFCVVDGVTGYLGSMNATENSETYHEVISVFDRTTAAQLTNMFEAWWRLGEEVNIERLNTLRPENVPDAFE